MMILQILLVTVLSIQGTFGVDTRNVNTGRVIGDLNTGYADQPMYVVFTFLSYDFLNIHPIQGTGKRRRCLGGVCNAQSVARGWKG